MVRLLTLVVVLIVFVNLGCLSSGIYRTAHVLPKGEGDFAMTFSVMRASTGDITYEDETGQTVTDEGKTVTIPNLFPEFSYHLGVASDLEIGGRVALSSAMLELGMKYRFVVGPGDDLHLAVQPAVGYRALIEEVNVYNTLRNPPGIQSRPRNAGSEQDRGG